MRRSALVVTLIAGCAVVYGIRRHDLRCLLLGHDDRIRRVPGRMYLECHLCGRQTVGWDLTPGWQRAAARPARPRLRARGWRDVWSQALRERLHAAGLR